MKAITLPPQNAELVALGHQTIVPCVSRPTVSPGDRLAIHASRYVSQFPSAARPIVVTPSVNGGPRGLSLDGVFGKPHPLHPGHVVASSVVSDVVKVVQFGAGIAPGQGHIESDGAFAVYWPTGWCCGADGRKVSDQIVLSRSFVPWGWALVLDDVKSTADRCPACWVLVTRHVQSVIQQHHDCPVWTFGMKPIPKRGHTGLWTVEW